MANNSDTANKFAFPKPDCNQLDAQTGMTLRDYFAAAALPEVMRAYEDTPAKDGEAWETRAARYAYEQADAMLKERSR